MICLDGCTNRMVGLGARKRGLLSLDTPSWVGVDTMTTRRAPPPSLALDPRLLADPHVGVTLYMASVFRVFSGTQTWHEHKHELKRILLLWWFRLCVRHLYTVLHCNCRHYHRSFLNPGECIWKSAAFFLLLAYKYWSFSLFLLYSIPLWGESRTQDRTSSKYDR